MLALSTGAIIALFFGGVLALAIYSIIYHIQAAKKRRGELAALAARLGFLFDPADRDGAPYWAEPFELFQRGHRYGTENHLAGTWGLADGEAGLRTDDVSVPAEIFDYTYYTESTDSKGNTDRDYYTRTVLALELPQVFPGITIKPDSAFREFFEFIGGRDIDFESNEFNKRFYVWSDDRKFAYAVVDVRMMEFLLQTRSAVRDIHLQIAGPRAIFFRERTLNAAAIAQLMRFAAEFYAHVPEYVKKDYARR